MKTIRFLTLVTCVYYGQSIQAMNNRNAIENLGRNFIQLSDDVDRFNLQCAKLSIALDTLFCTDLEAYILQNQLSLLQRQLPDLIERHRELSQIEVASSVHPMYYLPLYLSDKIKDAKNGSTITKRSLISGIAFIDLLADNDI